MHRFRQGLVLLALLFSIACIGQAEIEIRIVDAETEEPVSFATIRFKNTNKGLVADYYGEFRLPVTDKQPPPVLLISAIGYKSIEIDASSLSATSLQLLTLQPQVEELDAVILEVSKVNKSRAIQLNNIITNKIKEGSYLIVQKAIASIPKNLNDKPHSYLGYYRDYQMVNAEYFNLNEAIIEQFDSGIQSKKVTDKLNKNAVYYFRNNSDFRRAPELTVAYNEESKYIENADIMNFGGNELTILNVHNPIRNYDINTFSYVYQLNKDFIQYHKFYKGTVSLVEDDPVITIKFTSIDAKPMRQSPTQTIPQPEVSSNHKVNGQLTISLTDYAIYEFQYTMHDRNRYNPLFNLRTEYRRDQEKMYLNYISFDNRFVTKQYESFRDVKTTYNAQYNSIDIEFNSPLDESSLRTKNFKITFNNRRIYIDKAMLLDPETVQLKIASYDKALQELNEENQHLLDIRIKRLKDESGRKIYDENPVIAYQFREFFTQEVFYPQPLNTQLYFAAKRAPLIKAPINTTDNLDSYIINTPLKRVNLKRQIPLD